ncbi:PAS domain-containing sensor histidine kinase [Methanoregula sp.]|jgi:PAS domain S-box-containing protein|uniref:PAS domain-containing sensor histidine kinase n=1 Tax=Methanoregula sp. TaxID=2052170 RepID=UPI003C21456F
MKKQPVSSMPSTPAKKKPENPAGTKKVQKKTGTPGRTGQAMDWEAVFRAIGSSVVIVAPDHTLLAANNATCHISGKTEKELQGLKCWKVFHGHDVTHPPQGCPMELLLSSKKYETAEMEVSLNGGFYLVSCTPVVDEQGTISSVIHIATDITEKKKAERMVLESEDRFRKIFDNIPLGMALVTPDFRFFSVNPAFVSITGYSEKELLMLSFKDITHPDYLAGDMEHMRDLVAGTIPVYRTEKRYIRKDKSSIWVLLSVIPVRDLQGALLYFAGQIEDITLRRQAEYALRESEQRYRNILADTPAGYFQIDTQGKFTSVNQAWLRMHGFSSEAEVIGKHFSITQVDSDQRAAQENVEHLLNGETVLTGDFSRRIKDGTVGYHTFSASPVVRNGIIVGLEGFLIDITGRKVAEDALRESEEKYRILADISPEMIYLIDNDGYVKYINQAAARQLHAAPDDLVGKHLSGIFPAETAQNHLGGIRKVAADRRALCLEIPEDFPTGRVYIEARLVPVINNQNRVIGVLGISNDITRRKMAEAQRERLIRELAQKNAELDRFTFTVSHDLKSPLIAIRSFLSLLEDDLKSGDTGQVQRDISRISESAEKLEHLITTLLALSRSGRMVDKPVPVPFAALAREASGLLASSLREHGVTLVISDPMPVVYGDRQRLLQVMTNLLDNASKFMGDQKEPRIEIGVEEGPDGHVFYIRDNGTGINKENQENVFGLFERFNTEVPGSGIGLATVKRIIEAHGGKIWVESEGPGKGTMFRFTLPGAGVPRTDKDNNG